MTHPTPTEYAKARYGNAWAIVALAVKSGVLVKAPCPCGEPEVYAHHDDYARPLDVRWLCRPCHMAWHKTNEPKYLPNDLPPSRPRGRPTLGEHKRIARSMKASNAEWSRLKARAAEAGMSASAYIRDRCCC